MLNWGAMRRLFILGLALSLIVAGLAPLSACAMFSAQPAECAKAETPSPCSDMHPDDATPSFTTPVKSCCLISRAPLPELQYKAAERAPVITFTAIAILYSLPSVGRSGGFHRSVEQSSPPALRSLLCTLLI
jgi:hypothetical protein